MPEASKERRELKFRRKSNKNSEKISGGKMRKKSRGKNVGCPRSNV